MLSAIFWGKLKKSFGNEKSKMQMKVNVQMNVFAKSKYPDAQMVGGACKLTRRLVKI